MVVAILVMTDGREEYLDRCIESAHKHLQGPISEWWMHDDTGNEQYRADLRERYPDFTHIALGQRRGFGGAIAHAWDALSRYSKANWIFHLEQDFIFTGPVPLTDMIEVLEDHPHLAQMALRRQAWNEAEKAAGGVVELQPESYVSMQDMRARHWLEHRVCFTTNPCLYRRSTAKLGWPNVNRSEGHFTAYLLGKGYRFGYWGARNSGIWVEHIGHTRRGRGY